MEDWKGKQVSSAEILDGDLFSVLNRLAVKYRATATQIENRITADDPARIAKMNTVMYYLRAARDVDDLIPKQRFYMPPSTLHTETLKTELVAHGVDLAALVQNPSTDPARIGDPA